MPFGDNFVRGFDVGRRHKAQRERLQMEEEDRKLERAKLKFQMDRLKIEGQEAARKSAREEADFMSTIPERIISGEGEPERFEPHQPITLPEGGYGQAPMTIQPTGLRERLAMKMKADAEAKKLERTRMVTPEQAKAIGPGMLAGEMDESVLQQMADTSQATAQQTFQAGQGAANRKTQIDVANIYASNRGGMPGAAPGAVDPAVDTYARMLGAGDITLSQVPVGKDGRTRNAVIRQLHNLDMGIMSPKQVEKMSQFTGAKASIDKIRGSLEKIQQAKTAAEQVKWTLQLNSEVKGLSRNVGRNLGEKGVFTDQDKEDFAQIIQPGGGGIKTALAANLTPDMAFSRIAELEKFILSVEEREFGNVRARRSDTGAPGAGSIPGHTGGQRGTNNQTGANSVDAQSDFIVDESGNVVPNPHKRK